MRYVRHRLAHLHGRSSRNLHLRAMKALRTANSSGTPDQRTDHERGTCQCRRMTRWHLVSPRVRITNCIERSILLPPAGPERTTRGSAVGAAERAAISVRTHLGNAVRRKSYAADSRANAGARPMRRSPHDIASPTEPSNSGSHRPVDCGASVG